MALFQNAGEVTRSAVAKLEQVKPANGYLTDLKAVYGPTDSVRDDAPRPYALVRPASDRQGSRAARQAVRLREYEIEGVFSKAASEVDLAGFHVDVLRAFGIGQDLPERQFPGLLNEEGDEAEYRWAVKGENTHSITIRLGVEYVQTYN
jgi:hypothetical protein